MFLLDKNIPSPWNVPGEWLWGSSGWNGLEAEPWITRMCEILVFVTSSRCAHTEHSVSVWGWGGDVLLSCASICQFQDNQNRIDPPPPPSINSCSVFVWTLLAVESSHLSWSDNQTMTWGGEDPPIGHKRSICHKVISMFSFSSQNLLSLLMLTFNSAQTPSVCLEDSHSLSSLSARFSVCLLHVTFFLLLCYVLQPQFPQLFLR